MPVVKIDSEDLAWLLQFVPAWKEVNDIPRLMKLIVLLDKAQSADTVGGSYGLIVSTGDPVDSLKSWLKQNPSDPGVQSGMSVLSTPTYSLQLSHFASENGFDTESLPPLVHPNWWKVKTGEEFKGTLVRLKTPVKLYEHHGSKKIEAIKFVRWLTKWGLKEAKDFVEGVGYVPQNNVPVDWGILVCTPEEFAARWSEVADTGLVLEMKAL